VEIYKVQNAGNKLQCCHFRKEALSGKGKGKRGVV